MCYLSVKFFLHYTFFCRIFFALHFFLSNFFALHFFPSSILPTPVFSVEFFFALHFFLSNFFFITLFSVEFFLHYTFFCRIFFHYTFFCRIFFALHFFLSNFFFITLFSVEFFFHYTFFCRIFFHYTFFCRVVMLFLAEQAWASRIRRVFFNLCYSKKTFINFNKSFILGYICLYFREIREQKIQKFPKMKKISEKNALKIEFFWSWEFWVHNFNISSCINMIKTICIHTI